MRNVRRSSAFQLWTRADRGGASYVQPTATGTARRLGATTTRATGATGAATRLGSTTTTTTTTTEPGLGAPPPPRPPTGKPPLWRRPWFIITGAVVVGLVLFSILGAIAGDPKPSDTATPATAAPTTAASLTTVPPTSEPASTEPPTTAEPTTTAKPKPVASKTLLRAAVVEALRDEKKLLAFSANEGETIMIRWKIDENLTEGLTKDGARLDGYSMLKAIKAVPEHDRYQRVFLTGRYPLVDQYGNSSVETVIRAGYDRRTLERINFEGVRFKDIFDLADRGSIHPAFQY
jgi:hypothetical protein